MDIESIPTYNDKLVFLRGFYDNFGLVYSFALRCHLTNVSDKMLCFIRQLVPVPFTMEREDEQTYVLEFNGVNVIDLLGTLYSVPIPLPAHVPYPSTLPPASTERLIESQRSASLVSSLAPLPNTLTSRASPLSDVTMSTSIPPLHVPTLSTSVYASNFDKVRHKKQVYESWLDVPTLQCKVIRHSQEAVMPCKQPFRYSDAGMDLTIIKKAKQYTPTTTLYDTGISLVIPAGYYAEVVPRSSLSKTGYMLANSIGIIDNSYRGNIFIALTKIDPGMPELELPFRCCQIIFKKQIYMSLEDDNVEVEHTTRNANGFGSSG